ncbi:PilW family protein [Thiocapsa roseopersicina]|uniref:Prepilin-type N-terminal cleavage/methylation domain-containing protein n=1 Tax=Thiocapsa roseopersicina TaxID=1058 RepID=A0A1H2Z5E2_THIRO|nr:prepilin-type N-terminal cleavage/methylation domain-containing protein [Thiocapsa roseopersicina]SDX12009.1 hypothetical protein SAMN05421783_114115 [Thiocapsa roseopersicina]
MKSSAKVRGWSRRPISGFTLTELLVAMTLSLFIIGGALSVFVSSQETYRTKADLETSQEAIRFAAYTISRAVRSGTSVSGDNSTLVVTFERGDGVQDCLGEGKDDNPRVSRSNTFFRFGNTLRCNNGDRTEAIVTGLLDTQDAFSVLYGRSNDSSDWISDEDYVESSEINDFSAVRSVKVTLLTPAGTVSFVATLRNRVMLDLGGA